MSPFTPIQAFVARPILLSAIGAGAVAALLFYLVPNPTPPSIRPLLAWDVVAAVFVSATWWMMRDDEPGEMARRAEKTDEGRHLVLLLCVFAAALSIWAIALEFHQAKQDHGALRGAHIAFAVFTVALSWLFTHTVFAAHYAHEYYGPAPKAGTRGGLKFPGDDKTPNWGDFLHFSLVIGVAAQTADVQIESRAIRRTATWHGVVAFLFNTVLVAFTVNLAAGLL